MRQKLTQAFSRSRANSDLFSIYLTGWKRAPLRMFARPKRLFIKNQTITKTENCKFDKTGKFLPNRSLATGVTGAYHTGSWRQNKVLAPPG